jgi:hypothetical protein
MSQPIVPRIPRKRNCVDIKKQNMRFSFELRVACVPDRLANRLMSIVTSPMFQNGSHQPPSQINMELNAMDGLCTPKTTHIHNEMCGRSGRDIAEIRNLFAENEIIIIITIHTTPPSRSISRGLPTLNCFSPSHTLPLTSSTFVLTHTR